jgi:hypothetical protein
VTPGLSCPDTVINKISFTDSSQGDYYAAII